uniref:B-cell lymphoma 9 beta-catenin binding domain-containing protein n=1 Tax=Phlebotomus papatasi TaxID=29031 RepID=A0A1B0DLN7_PHLPP
MLKEKREKGGSSGTPASSPRDPATPPSTPPTLMTIKEERVKQEPDQEANTSPKRPASSSPRPSQSGQDRKSEPKDAQEDGPDGQPNTKCQVTVSQVSSGSGSETEPTFTSSIQPLVSNLMGKQSGGLEYMQQSSQIFVFSTTLANKGAESVLNGHYPSIIAYHCAQPGTKKILEKHPLKLGQFNRHTPWSLMGTGGGSFGSGSGPKAAPSGRTKGQLGLMEGDGGDGQDANGPDGPASWQDVKDGEEMANGTVNASLVQGVKVPDENLTPQQRQHREEQLAMIRKMHLMLFPEQSDDPQHDGGPADEDKHQTAAGGHCPDYLPCPTQPMAAPGGAYAKMAPQDWTRLQHQYCEEQQRKGGGGGGGGGRGSNSGGQRTHGPPPPYHQTPRSASVPIATHSPSPNSPQNLTSTLSLPSPRGTTLASPSDSSRHGAPLRHLSAGQSPVSGGSPAALSRPLAQSSPATPSSAHLSPCSGPFKDVDLPPPDDKLPPSSPARGQQQQQQQQQLEGSSMKVEGSHVPSPGVQCSPAHEKGAFFADISPEANAQEHVSMGSGNFGLPDDNLPLNPDTSTAPETTKVMPFDPISSLAQMSQQLTSAQPPFNGGGGPNGGGPNGAIMAAQMQSYGDLPAMQQQMAREADDAMLECAQLHGMMVQASEMGGPPPPMHGA